MLHWLHGTVNYCHFNDCLTMRVLTECKNITVSASILSLIDIFLKKSVDLFLLSDYITVYRVITGQFL